MATRAVCKQSISHDAIETACNIHSIAPGGVVEKKRVETHHRLFGFQPFRQIWLNKNKKAENK
jgi:hypothetical protein